MTPIAAWAEQVLRTVELDGASVVRVRLITNEDGQCWETWYAPWPTPEEFEALVQTKIRQLESEFPARQVSMTLEADNSTGETVSRFSQRVVGRAKQGTLDSAQAAQAVVFDTLASTIEKLQRLTNTQLDEARRQLELQAEVSRQQLELIRAYRNRDALGEEEEDEGPLIELAREQLPALIELGKLALENKMKGSDE